MTTEVILTDLKRLTDCPKYCNPKTLLPAPLTDRRALLSTRQPEALGNKAGPSQGATAQPEKQASKLR